MLKILDRSITIKSLSIVIMASVIFLTLISVDLSSEFNGAGDIFHQGELVANYWHMLSYYKNQESFPLLIHGSMDYWPSLMAGIFYGDDNIIYGTRLIVVIATLMSWFIFSTIGFKIISQAGNNSPLMLGFVLVFCLTLPLLNLNLLSIIQSPVGLRDLFVLSQILALTYFYLSKKYNAIFLALAFLLLPVALCWSYDRGVASTIACSFLLAHFVFSKKYFEFFVSISSLAVSLAIFETFKLAGTVTENISNILYWVGASSEVWGTALNINRHGAISLLPLSFIAVALYLTYVSWRNKENIIPVGFVIFMIVFELLLVKSAYNRPEILRGLMSTWPAALLLLWIASCRFTAVVELKSTTGIVNTSQGRLLKISSFLFIISALMLTAPFKEISSFKKSLMSPPSDTTISGAELVAVSDYLKGETCFLNMINQGVITLLSKSRHCTKFPYLVYANKKSQLEIIGEIDKLEVDTVIIESHDWSTNIDNRTMESRLPELYSYLIERYQKNISVGHYLALKELSEDK